MSEGTERDDRSAQDIVAQILAEETARIAREEGAAGTDAAVTQGAAGLAEPQAAAARGAAGTGAAGTQDSAGLAEAQAGATQGAASAPSFSPDDAPTQLLQPGAWDLPDP